MNHFILFSLDQQEYAIDMTSVGRVIRAVEITPLPTGSSEKNLLGVINFHQKIVSVVDFRQILGLPYKTLEVSDEIILIDKDTKTIALLVDRVTRVLELTDQEINSSINLDNNKIIRTINQSNQKMLFICDLAQLMAEVSVYDRV